MYARQTKLSARMLLVALALSVSSCASGPVSSDFCTLDSPIFVSEQDVLTDATVDAITDHNVRYEAVCGES